MSKPIKLPDDLVEQARQEGKASKRSIAGQIVHWSKIGKMVEENPDLPYSFIKDILLARQEMKEGLFTPSEFGR